jgi:uncharacterized membrane protein YeaQ/YmgE (transglycosylase-associated protein family)
MLTELGLQTADPEAIFATAAMAFAAIIAFGWGADAILQEAGFGLAGNAIIAVVGAFLGTRIWLSTMGHIARYGGDLTHLLLFSGAVATLAVVGAAFIKKAVVRA